ncbi:uncharacterized protein [Ptychodera flava]|uniref:uncharacterized protein n=1 Tax=Ptychodera flava TaxID=63121 RepID=UPI00396A7733
MDMSAMFVFNLDDQCRLFCWASTFLSTNIFTPFDLTFTAGCEKAYDLTPVSNYANWHIYEAQNNVNCCIRCSDEVGCGMWFKNDSGCFTYSLGPTTASEGNYVGYPRGRSSLLAYDASVHVGMSEQANGNPACGMNVNFSATLDRVLEFRCDQKFGRYVSIEQTGSFDQLRFCEVEVFADYVNYINIGCYGDESSRAIPYLEGDDTDWLHDPYKVRVDSFEKCAFSASRLGYSVYALQDGGQCFSSGDAGLTFDKYGPSEGCGGDGLGGVYANQVYLKVDPLPDKIAAARFVNIGCYIADPGMETLEGTDSLLSDDYRQRDESVLKCAHVATGLRFVVFGVQDGGKCMSSALFWSDYRKLGRSDTCVDGRGAADAVDVYAVVHGIDDEPPVVSCPDVTNTTLSGSKVGVINLNGMTVSDNIALVEQINITCNHDVNGEFNVGNSLVDCTFIDLYSNMASCTFNVLILDEEPPVGHCANVTNTTLPGGNVGVITGYQLTVTDNVDISDEIVKSCTPNLHGEFIVGSSSVYCKFTDLSNNMGHCTFHVLIEDNDPPSPTCHGVVNTTLPRSNVGVISSFNVSVTDNVDKGGITTDCSPYPGSNFYAGETQVSCFFTDTAGNQASCEFTVTIADNEAPEVTCSNISARVSPSSQFTLPTFDNFYIVDNVDSESDVSYTCQPSAGDITGSTPVTCTFEDSSGNSAMCSFVVYIGVSCIVPRPGSNETAILMIDSGGSVFASCSKGWSTADGTGTGVLMVCSDGELSSAFPECTDIDECTIGSHNCDLETNNEICINEPPGSFTCMCLPDFRKTDNAECLPDIAVPSHDQCEGVGGLKCQAETDELYDEFWPETLANCVTSWRKCPTGTYGNMLRYCAADGVWQRPDTTFCTSETLEEILSKALAIRTTVDAEEIVDETKTVVSAGKVIYGGDLMKVIEILKTVLHKDPLNLVGSTETKINFTLGFMKIINDLLSNHNQYHWDNIHKDRGINKGTALVFKALERFNEGVSQFIIESNVILYVSSTNIEYQAYLVQTGGRKMDSLAIDHMISSRERRNAEQTNASEAVLLSTEITGEANETVLIAFVYHNTGNLLPVEDTQRYEAREWVKSITAVKRIQKVNSPVLSVKLYSDSDSSVRVDSLTLKLNHKEEGYNAACVKMVYDRLRSIWDKESCSIISLESTDSFTICKCDGTGTNAVIMVIGKPPIPFYTSARKAITVICNGMSVFLLVTSVVMASLSRMKTTKYNLLRASMVSFILMPVLTIVAECQDSVEGGCPIIGVALLWANLVNIAWIMNLSIELLLRLSFYVHTSRVARVAYVLTGFVFPAVVLLWLTLSSEGVNDDTTSCWRHLESTTIHAVCVPRVIMFLVSLVCLGCTHCMFNKEKQDYEPREWQKFWEELRSAMQLLFVDGMYWISYLCTVVTDDLIAGYAFAFLAFVFASVVFLSSCATRFETLQAIRIHFCGDPDSKAAFTEDEKTEYERFDDRRQIKLETIQESRELIKSQKEAERVQNAKSDGIEGLFLLATKTNAMLAPRKRQRDTSV